MRRHLAAVGALLTASAVVLGLTAGTAAAATAPTEQAIAALRYLSTQIGPTGAIAGSAGATEDAVISDADNGFDPATMHSASAGTTSFAYLSSQESSISTAGAAAKFVLAWVASGKPAAIDGTAMLDKLNTLTTGGGFLTAAGTFHNGSASIETANSYSQSLAILADVAAHRALPTKATAWLSCAQRLDGGFGYAINDATATPPAFCGDTTSDTNDTGIVLQALGAARVHSANPAAKTYLHAAQQGDAGFGFAAGGPSDPDSDAVVIQGLLAIGQDPTTWVVGGANPLSNLVSFADPHGSGGFVFPGNSSPDAFTTTSIPQALALKPYAASAPFTAGLSPVITVPAPTPTATPAGGTAAITVPPTGAADRSGLRALVAIGLVLVGAGSLVAAVKGRRRRIIASATQPRPGGTGASPTMPPRV